MPPAVGRSVVNTEHAACRRRQEHVEKVTHPSTWIYIASFRGRCQRGARVDVHDGECVPASVQVFPAPSLARFITARRLGRSCFGRVCRRCGAAVVLNCGGRMRRRVLLRSGLLWFRVAADGIDFLYSATVVSSLSACLRRVRRDDSPG